MNKKLTICILLGFTALIGHCNAQSIRLTSYRSLTNITLDLNRAYNYNIYERNRWGMGIDIIQPLKYDKRYGTLFQNAFLGSAYVGYGTGDHAWKYGGMVGLVFPRSVFRGFDIYYQHDLLRVGSHSFDNYNIFNTTDNSSYFSSRYAGVDCISAHTQIDIPGPAMLHIGYTHSRERLLFDATGLLYPSIYDDDAMPYQTFDEAGIDLYWGDHWKLGVLAGVTDGDGTKRYARVLAQYSNRFDFGDKAGSLRPPAVASTISTTPSSPSGPTPLWPMPLHWPASATPRAGASGRQPFRSRIPSCSSTRCGVCCMANLWWTAPVPTPCMAQSRQSTLPSQPPSQDCWSPASASTDCCTGACSTWASPQPIR